MNKNVVSLPLLFLLGLTILSGCEKERVQGSVPSPADARLAFESRRADAVARVDEAKASVAPPQRVDLTPLQGYKLGDLYSGNLGLKHGQLVPRYVDVSFDERMGHFYRKKILWEKCKKSTGVCKEATETVLSKAPQLYERYLKEDKQKMNLLQFVAVADSKIAEAKKYLDYKKLCTVYRLDDKKCRLLKAIVSNLKGKDMVAYGMTELLPSADGKLNVRYMDILLRHAGAEFFYHVPALGDGLASLGLYQFTMFALRDDDEVTEGASMVNSFVSKGGPTIPGSVVYLEGHQHHVAAFYFAVHNLAKLVGALSPKGVTLLSAKHGEYQDEMVIYIACAHHLPGVARPRTARWINGGFKSSLFVAYGKTPIARYAVKTKGNLLALYGKV